MKRSIRAFSMAVVAIGAIVPSCADVAGPAGVCLSVVNVQGIMYTTAGGSIPAASISAEAFAEVMARRPCIDVNPSEGANIVQPGDSNFLDQGTKLHTVEGFTAEERLAFLAFPDGSATDGGEWQILIPIPGS
jgi:hypothetical protein